MRKQAFGPCDPSEQWDARVVHVLGHSVVEGWVGGAGLTALADQAAASDVVSVQELQGPEGDEYAPGSAGG